MRCNATQGGNRCGKSQQNHIFLLQTCHFPLPVPGSTGAASCFKSRPNSWPSGCGMTTWCTASSSLQSDALCDIDDEDGPPTDGSVESPPGGDDGDGSTASCAANPCHDPCQRGRVAPNRECERLVLSDGQPTKQTSLFRDSSWSRLKNCAVADVGVTNKSLQLFLCMAHMAIITRHPASSRPTCSARSMRRTPDSKQI